MANVMLNEEHLVNIADAIREKNGSEDTYTPGAMADAIRDIPQEGGNYNDGSYYYDIASIEAMTTKGKFQIGLDDGGYMFQNYTYDDNGNIIGVELGNNIAGEMEYDEDGNLIRLYSVEAMEPAEVYVGLRNLTFDEAVAVSYPDFTLNGSALRMNSEHVFMGQEYTIPDGATTMICDIVANKLDNTTAACVVYPTLTAGFIMENELLGGNERYDLFGEDLPTGTGVSIDLTDYIKGTQFDAATLGTGTMTGKFKLGMRNTKSGSSMTSTTFGFEIAITNIRFE